MPFAPVYNAKDADVIVTAEIKEYVFTEKALPTVFGGMWGVVADTATPKSLAKLVVDYKVINAKNDKLLLEYKYFATEEKRPREDMKGAQAFIHAANKNINRFIYRAFHYQRRKGGFQIQ